MFIFIKFYTETSVVWKIFRALSIMLLRKKNSNDNYPEVSLQINQIYSIFIFISFFLLLISFSFLKIRYINCLILYCPIIDSYCQQLFNKFYITLPLILLYVHN